MGEEEVVDFSKMALEDRLVHKNWKARVSGYDDLIKLFQMIDDEKSPEWGKFTGLVRKFPLDSNAAALEKGLEATLAFAEGAFAAGKITAEVMSGVVAKCIIATRAKTKELTQSIVLMFVEIEKFEVVQEELMKGMEHKNPKVIAGSITLLTQALKEFGPKVINLKTLIKKLLALIEDRDKTVRDESKKLAVELNRWIGAAFKPQLSTLKPVVLQELEAEMEKITDKPTQTRLLRSQQAKKEKILAEGGDPEAEEAATQEAAPEIDPYDLMEPVDILSKIPKDFYEKMESKKWQDRKDALEAVEALTKSPKLEPGDYADLVRVLMRVIGKDNNVLVVALAGKCIHGLANGLKKKFSPYAPSAISTILEKFKEKKTNVVTAMREAADACFVATSLENIQEYTITSLANKNPAVKQETCLFLARSFAKISLKTVTDKKLMKPFYVALILNINESDPNVRDAAAEVLGVAMKSGGEKAIMPFLQDIEAVKLQKVKEFCEKAVITRPAGPKISKPAPKPAEVKPSSAPMMKKPPPKPAVKKSATAPRPAPIEIEEDIDMDETEKIEMDSEGGVVTRIDISPQITEALITELSDKNWKTRENALDKIQSMITSPKGGIKGTLGELPMALGARLNDSNRNLASTTFLVCQHLGTALGPYCKTHMSTLLPAILSGLGDSKVAFRSNVVGCLNAWAEGAGINEVFQAEIIAGALNNGNPNLKTELFNWLTERLPNMRGASKDELSACLPALLSSIDDRNPEVRKSGQEAVFPFMLHLGFEQMNRAAGNLKPASKSVVVALLEKVRPNLPPKPTTAGKGKGIPHSNSAQNIAKPGSSASGRSVDKPESPPDRASAPKSGRGSQIPNKSRGNPPVTSAGAKKAGDEPIGTNLQVNNSKQQRFNDENKLKIIRWQFTAPREEFVELLKEMMTNANFGKSLVTYMFSPDFKMHIKAIDILTEELAYSYEGILSNLDLILKWFTLRFFDTNPSVLIRGLDFISNVFKTAGDVGFSLHDLEARAFLPSLMLKIGEPKDIVRASVHGILRHMLNIWQPQKLFAEILSEGLKSKNARQRAETLDELSFLVANYGLTIASSSPGALKEVAKQISDRDNSVRNAALNCVVQAYFLEGEKIYKMVGNLSDKDLSLLEERVKRAKPNPPSRPKILSASSQPRTGSAINNTMVVGNNSISPPRNDQQYQNLNTTMTVPNPFHDMSNGNGEMMNHHEMSPESQYMSEPEVPVENPSPPKRNQYYTTLPEKYRIDFEKIDAYYDRPEIGGGPMPPLKLLDTDISWLLNDPPITLPQRSTTTSRSPRLTGGSPANGSPGATEGSPPNIPDKALQMIDVTIAQVASHDISLSMSAVVQLEPMVNDPEGQIGMSLRVNEMISMISMQLRRLQPTLISLPREVVESTNRLYRAITVLLQSLFKSQTLPVHVSKDSIKDLVFQLLSLIVDPHLTFLPDATLISKQVNVMVVRIIERSEPTSVICGMIRLMNESLTYKVEPKMLELVMKCNWKLLKQFAVWKEGGVEYKVKPILHDFALFLRTHPFDTFNGRDVTPMKTMKTFYHSLIINIGPEVVGAELEIMHELDGTDAGLYMNKVARKELAKLRGVTSDTMSLDSGRSGLSVDNARAHRANNNAHPMF